MDESKKKFIRALAAKSVNAEKAAQNKAAFLTELRDASEPIFRDIIAWVKDTEISVKESKTTVHLNNKEDERVLQELTLCFDNKKIVLSPATYSEKIQLKMFVADNNLNNNFPIYRLTLDGKNAPKTDWVIEWDELELTEERELTHTERKERFTKYIFFRILEKTLQGTPELL